MDNPVDEDHASFRLPSLYCDCQSEIIRRAAGNIIHGTESQEEMAVAIFYWVRDNIKYELGLIPDSASATLVRGAGSCTNKANLTVALLRAVGFSAGFHVMEVKTREYFGALCTERFARYMSERSLHIYCSVFIRDRWIKVDPSDDIRLSNSTRHLAFQATPVRFDGRSDAVLHLDPSHVLSDSQHRLATVDSILAKPRRIPAAAVDLMNFYLDHLRNCCIWNSSVESIENDFFQWLHAEKPDLLAALAAIGEATTSTPSRVIPATGAAG